MLTGKNRKQFEEWYNKRYPNDGDVESLNVYRFYLIPPEMQLGVYLAYYRSIGYDIETLRYEIYSTLNGCYYEWIIIIDNENQIEENKEFNSRDEAYKEAFKKADELINEEL